MTTLYELMNVRGVKWECCRCYFKWLGTVHNPEKCPKCYPLINKEEEVSDKSDNHGKF